MRLAVTLGYWSAGGPGSARDAVVAPANPFLVQRDLAQLAERLGYDSVWAAEAYGSDAATVLAALAVSTTRIGLGSAVFQLPARSAAMTAMTAATLDVLSGGRFRLGLGVSGPQVSEGWHGVRFDRPLARTREYVDVVRLALSHHRVAYQGEHLHLPLPDGPGKALRLGVRTAQQSVPIYLAAVGPKNLELAGRIADGWLGLFFAPDHAAVSLDPLTRGRIDGGRAGDPDQPMAGFDVCVSVPTAVGQDVAAAIDRLRPYYALYVGGMGSRDKNFYHATATRLGFGAQADTVQELYLAGRHAEAAAALPADLIEATALVGPAPRIASALQRFADAGVSTLTVDALAGAPADGTAEHALTVVHDAGRRTDVVQWCGPGA